MERYDNAFAQLKSRRRRFVPFVTPGDPGPEQSLKIIDALIEAGADALELGIPFSTRWRMARPFRTPLCVPLPRA